MKTATIVIRDEVNIKIEGLELDARRALVNAFKYDVPGARYLPAVRLGRWDGKVSYFQLGGSTYVNLLPEIVPILEKFNYDIELDDQRTYSTTFDFDHIKEDSFAHKVWPRHILWQDNLWCCVTTKWRLSMRFLATRNAYKKWPQGLARH